MSGLAVSKKLNCRVRATGLLATVAICLAWEFAAAQEAAPRVIAGLQPAVPVVPTLPSRPAEGPGDGQQWRTQPTEDEKKPVAEFLDSLKGNDAALEVVVGQGRLLTTKEPIARERGTAVIAVGDPTVIDFEILPDPRMIRLTGRRAGVTDLMIVTTSGQNYTFEIHVVYDLDILRAQLKQIFPDAFIKLGQIREHLVVEGEARSDAQVHQILNTIRAYLASVQVSQRSGSQQGKSRPTIGEPAGTNRQASNPDPQTATGASPPDALSTDQPDANGENQPSSTNSMTGTMFEEGGRPSAQAAVVAAQIINLLKVPGVHQVLLKVQIAEVNRTALRQIGADIIAPKVGNNSLASLPTGNNPLETLDGLAGLAGGNLVGVFNGGSFAVVMQALRQNNVATVLAEPNLVTLNGHVARFQSGGEFPVPVAQMGGGAGNNSVEFKPFGVQLAFIPYIQDDGLIRLHVEPEVSTIDQALAVTLIVNGDPIPGVRTRNASTTVELREGQTLAIAGLLDRSTDGSTARIPFLGDLPYLGPLFSNTRHQVLEQELLVAVTPYLISPVNAGECLQLPGQEVMEPNDLEFYLLNRIEGRTGQPHRSTGQWDNPFSCQSQMQMEQQNVFGPTGLSQ
jgi:pilus assembly protein CpaC